MSDNIDFEFGRSIGATGYCELSELPNGVQFMRNVSGESYEYHLSGEWVLGYNTGIIDLYKPIPPADTWAIHNNTLPLRELSDEHRGSIVGSWASGCIRQVLKDNGEWLDLDESDCVWRPSLVYRIKPKSEREVFVDKLFNLGDVSGSLTKEECGIIFDAIQRGDIKAPTPHKE